MLRCYSSSGSYFICFTLSEVPYVLMQCDKYKNPMTFVRVTELVHESDWIQTLAADERALILPHMLHFFHINSHLVGNVYLI